ncbi:hypothetical protein [Streptomyces sp. cg35]|uniref:hypothetical protein n=1 Tax=Streptomyces sp. cg35 TaxID=3421650 RepID=UPI003D1679E8
MNDLNLDAPYDTDRYYDIVDALDRRGWTADPHLPLMTHPDGTVWSITTRVGDSGVDAPDKSWSIPFDSSVPAHVIVATCDAVVAGAPSEDFSYQVVGGWGVDGADSVEHGRKIIADHLRQYPGDRVPERHPRVDRMLTQTWDDGAQYTGASVTVYPPQ